ncbi:MAG: galactokinase, partial [Anaerolineae bacterium]
MNSSHLTTLLQQVYDADPSTPAPLQAQISRYQEALHVFRLAFGAGPVHIYRAPGRVNLIGEHTDYNHGFVLPMALEKDILLLARPRSDGRVILRNIEPARFPERRFTLSASIRPGPVGDWANYVKGPAQSLACLLGISRGMDALVVGRAPFGVPIGTGLSSSSALTVASAMALLDLNHGAMPPMDFAEFCAQAEWYVGTRGGIMDHFTSVMGRRGHALFLDCRPVGEPPARYHAEWVPLPTQYSILVCDSGKRRANTLSDFNVRVAECKLGAALLQRRWPAVTHLRDVTPERMGFAPADLDAFLAEHLPEEADFQALRRLGLPAEFLEALAEDHRLPPAQVFRIRARCRHVIRENQRVLDSISALRASDGRRFG